MDTVTDQELSGAKTIVPFQTYEEQARAIVAEAADLKVTDATQVTLIKRSKELRLKAKHTRCAVETLRKEKVEGFNKATKAKAEAERKAAAAPDREKLTAYIAKLEAVEIPKGVSFLSETIAQKLDDLLDWIRNKRDSL